MAKSVKEIADWLRQRVNAAGARGIVVGLSGGIDSAVVVRLAQIAAPGQTVGVIMPCGSDPRDEADARLVAEGFGIPVLRVDLAAPYEALVTAIQDAMAALPVDLAVPAAGADSDPRARMPLANVKPRLRMTTLYYLANTLNYLVAGTGNRAELTVGYFTKYGDGGVDVLPIGDLLKSDVRAMARELDVPDRIIEKPPSAGLWAGQTDEAEMGTSYAELEQYLTGGPEAVAPALALRLERMIRASEHKRSMPPTPRTT